jgi:hypothetical protein
MNFRNHRFSEMVIQKLLKNGSCVESLAVILFATTSGSGFVVGDSGVLLSEQAVHDGHVKFDFFILPTGDSGLDEFVDYLKNWRSNMTKRLMTRKPLYTKKNL